MYFTTIVKNAAKSSRKNVANSAMLQQTVAVSDTWHSKLSERRNSKQCSIEINNEKDEEIVTIDLYTEDFEEADQKAITYDLLIN